MDQAEEIYHFSDWEKAHPLLKSLRTDKVANLRRLISWGWYSVPHLFIESKEISKCLDKLSVFCASAKRLDRCLILRAIPLHHANPRKSFVDCANIEEIISIVGDFCNKGDYIFIVCSVGPREWVGNAIVFRDETVIIEMLESSHHSDLDQSTKSTKIYDGLTGYSPNISESCIFLSRISATGMIIHPTKLPIEARQIIYRVIKKIRKGRGEFCPGYYEFVYSKIDGLYFIDAIFEDAYLGKIVI